MPSEIRDVAADFEMLDWNDPQSTHVMTAGVLKDDLTGRILKMTTASSRQRHELLDESRRIINAMRTLNLEHFRASLFISRVLTELEQELFQLVGKIPQNTSSVMGRCNVCDEALLAIPEEEVVPFCPRCAANILPLLEKLASDEGFGTVYI